MTDVTQSYRDNSVHTHDLYYTFTPLQSVFNRQQSIKTKYKKIKTYNPLFSSQRSIYKIKTVDEN